MSLFDKLKEAAAETARNAAMSQIPRLVENYSQQLGEVLVSALKKLKNEHPEKAKVFLQRWRSINKHVEAVFMSRGGTRTRRQKLRVRK
jgi:hypothetical protein